MCRGLNQTPTDKHSNPKIKSQITGAGEPAIGRVEVSRALCATYKSPFPKMNPPQTGKRAEKEWRAPEGAADRFTHDHPNGAKSSKRNSVRACDFLPVSNRLR